MIRTALTLVELLIVMAILSVITAIALPVTRNMIEENRISSASRTIRAYMEHARARAMESGREYGVAFERAGTANEALYGTVRELSLVSGAPRYRGDVEGARCWLYHETTMVPRAFGSTGIIASGTTAPAGALAQLPNAAIFDPVQCPSLKRTVDVLVDIYDNNSTSVPPLQPGDFLVLDGQRFPIYGFSYCSGSETPFTTGAAVSPDPTQWIKVYFDPRSDSGEARVDLAAQNVMMIAQPPRLQAGTTRASQFEIIRTRLRGSGVGMELPRGAAVDLYFSGVGPTGADFSPMNVPEIKTVVVVFSPAGLVSRVHIISGTSALTTLNASPKSSIFFLVGRSDQVRPDLLSPLSLTTTAERAEMSNVMDPSATWVSINPLNGRITTSDVGGPTTDPASLDERLLEARRPALAVRESNR